MDQLHGASRLANELVNTDFRVVEIGTPTIVHTNGFYVDVISTGESMTNQKLGELQRKVGGHSSNGRVMLRTNFQFG